MGEIGRAAGVGGRGGRGSQSMPSGSRSELTPGVGGERGAEQVRMQPADKAGKEMALVSWSDLGQAAAG